MENVSIEDMNEALQAIKSMINKSENAQEKFLQATSQYALLKNRINALRCSFKLIENIIGKDILNEIAINDIKEAIVPIKSLISKSEKVQTKLKPTTWQYNMLSKNLKALYIALPLLMDAINKQ